MPLDDVATEPDPLAGLDDAVGGVLHEKTAVLRNNVMTATAGNADQEAQFKHISQYMGMPIDSVRAQPEAVRAQVAARDLDASNLTAQFPHTAQYLTDPTNASIAHDDLPVMKGIESQFSQWNPSMGERLHEWWREAFNLPEREHARAANAYAAMQAGMTPQQARDAVGGMSELPTQAASGFAHTATFGIVPDVEGDPTTAGGVVGKGTGDLLGFLASPAKAGSMAVEQLGIKGLERQAGDSFAKAVAKDVVNGSLVLGGATGVSSLVDSINSPDATTAAKKVGTETLHGAEMGGLFGMLGRLFPDSTILQNMLRVGGANAGVDVLQGKEPFEDVKNWDTLDSAQRASAVFNYGLNTLFSLHGAGRAEGGWFKDAARADAAEQDAKTIAAVTQLSTASKLRERDPDGFHDFVTNMTQDTPAADLYVDAKTFAGAMQQSGVTEAMLDAKMPGVTERLREGLATEGDVRIPMADYATHLAGGPLAEAIMPHLKTDPEGMTFEQSQLHAETQVEALRAEAEKMANQQESADGWRTSAKSVEDELLGQLNTANRFSSDVNSVYAKLAGAMNSIAAARAGRTPEEQYAKYPLDILSVTAKGKRALMEQPGVPVPFDATDAPSVSMRPQKADAEAPVIGVHYSKAANLSEVSGSYNGTGARGAEAGRLAEAMDARLKNRSYFYAADGYLPDRETGTGAHAHVAQLTNLYDFQKDPAGLLEKVKGLSGNERANALETAMLDAGYDGYRNGRSIVVLDGTTPVKYLGNDSDLRRSYEDEQARRTPEPGTGSADVSAPVSGAGIQRGGRSGDAGLAEAQRAAAEAAGGARGLEGLPTSLLYVDRKAYIPGPFHLAREVAAEYARTSGVAYDPPKTFQKVDPERAKRIAQAFEEMKHDPNDPEVKASYDALIKETLAQWQAIKNSGLVVEFIKPDQPDPYATSPRAAIMDVIENNHLWAFKTESGFGSDKTDVSGNPLLAKTGEMIGDHELLANDVFRIVHDYFGYIKEGTGFRADGEENAWREHAAMFSPLARRALTTETRGQNSWVNFGPHAETNKTASAADTHYAPQKIGLLPEWVSEEGRLDPKPFEQRTGAQSPRGQITFPKDITQSPSTISLLQNADLSTFLHELGHFNLQVMTHMASEKDGAPEIKQDMDHVLNWFGVKDLDTWNTMTLDQQRVHHEQFARGFEAYLFEGKSPNLEMQGIFSRMRAWLIHVYKSLGALNVQLTPEVRGVMDRLIASAEDIKQAQEARGMSKLFETKPEGMDDATWASYNKTDQDATETALSMQQTKSLRDMKWLSNAKSKVVRDLQREANAQRKAIKDEVEKTLAEQPVYKAEEWLRSGKMTDAEGNTVELAPEARKGAKISKQALEAMFPEGTLARPDLDALKGLTSTEGMAPDMVADIFGFKSGRELVDALLNKAPKKEVIEGMTDQLMLERHGEMVDREAIERSAEASVHNELRARVIATEYKTLARVQGSVSLLAKAAKEAAETTIASRRIKDVRPKEYGAAEARASREADKAMSKADPTAAAQAKRAQLVNNRLAKAATEALTEVDKTIARFKRLDKKAAQNNMRGEYLEQLNALLDRFDLRVSTRPPAIDRPALADYITAESERLSAVVPDLPGWVLNENFKTHYKNLTVEEMRGLSDTVKQLEHMARREQKQYMAIRAMEFAAERGEVLDEIRKNWSDAFDKDGEPKGIEPDFVPGLKKSIGKLGDKFAGEFLSPETIYSILGGGKFSVINESLFGRMSTRSDWKAQRLGGLYEKLKPLFDSYNLKEKHAFARDDIGSAIDTPLTRENALVVALLHGNAEGRERLKNYGWSEFKQAQIIGLLDARDMKLADGIWRIFDENLWPELKDLNDRTRGKAPPKVVPLPYETAHGTARGGYFRLKYDTNLDERAHRLDEGQVVKELLGGGMGMSAKTNQGSSTERKENVVLRPRLDLGVFSEAVNETVHDLAYREAVADTIRMLNDKGIMSAIKQVVGTEGYRALVNRVREVAAPPRNPSGFVEKAISIARRNTVINLMSGVKTALQNFTGIAPALAELNAGTLGAEVAKFYSPKMLERHAFVMSQSEYMRQRFTHYDRDLQTEAKKLTVNGRILPAESAFLGLMGMVDKGVSVPVWNAAFKQGMEKFENDNAKAVEYADHIVRQTQGSGRDVDLPSIMSGHGGWGQLKKAFTMFYSYFNGQLNLLVKHGVISKIEARDNPAKATADFAAKFVAIIAIPTILTEMLMNGAVQDNEDAGHMALRYAGAFVRYGAGFVPLVRDMVPAIWTQLTGDGHYFGVKVSPVDSAMSGIVEAVKSAKDVSKGENDAKDTKNLIMGAGYMFGLPGKLVADTVDGTRAWLKGEAGPQAVVLGPPKKP